jgi:hypothetical protein
MVYALAMAHRAGQVRIGSASTEEACSTTGSKGEQDER